MALTKKWLRAHWNTVVLCAISLALFLIPNVLWGNLYMVGGDDSRLYYIAPWEFLKNFSFNVISNNTLGGNLGYMVGSFSAPVIVFLLLLKNILPFLNTQLASYGIILCFGFIYFYLSLKELVHRETTYSYWARIVASIFYILSPYITKTYFQHQYISIFLLMVVPGSLYYFILGLKRKNVAWIIYSSLFYSIFSSTIYSFPWFFPVLITLLPLMFYLAVQYRWHFWKMLVIFLLVTVVSNVYWLVHYIIPVVFKTGETSFASSLLADTFKKQNSDLIAALSYLNSPTNQMTAYLRVAWTERFGVTTIRSVGVLYLMIIAYAGSLLHKVKRDIRQLYIVIVLGLLLTMLFITPNFGLWNVQFFQFLNAHVPFFAIVRHMYDKFALAIAFYYALALYVSLIVLEETNIKLIYRYMGLFVVFITTIIFSSAYLYPRLDDTVYSTRISGQMNKDFEEMTQYIQSLHTSSRFLWYPMTFPGYVYISDSNNPNHFYTGVSPLRIFAQASDMAGFYGLQTAHEPELNWKILDLLKNKNYSEIAKRFEQMNIGYVIVNHEKIPKEGSDQFNQFDFVTLQNDTYLQTILGEKIKDFGTRYSLYAFHKAYYAPTLFITKSLGQPVHVDKKINFQKNNIPEYTSGTFTIHQDEYLVLLEPYNLLWKLELEHAGKKSKTLDLPHIPAYGYGNAWEIHARDIIQRYPEMIDIHSSDSATIRIRIHFWPADLTYPALYISALSSVIAGAYGAYMLMKKKR